MIPAVIIFALGLALSVVLWNRYRSLLAWAPLAFVLLWLDRVGLAPDLMVMDAFWPGVAIMALYLSYRAVTAFERWVRLQEEKRGE